MNEEILKSIQEELTKQSNAFKAINDEITTVYNQYNTKLAQIEKEGNTKIKELQNKREQIRGAYTVLLNQYNKFTTQDGQTEEPVKQEDVKEPENKERAEVVETPRQEKQEKQEQPKRGRKPKVQKADTNTGLSKADMEKLKQLEKYGEAPDYLKDQYNN